MMLRLNDALRRHDRDEGFSVIEVTVAIAVFAMVATFMSQMLAGGLKGVLLGKRREVATQEANRTIEIARSLRFDDIGLVTSDATINSDSAITSVSGKKSFRSDTSWEPIIFAVNGTNHPFTPHVQSMDRSSTRLQRSVYVTGVDSDADGEIDMKRLSVRVSWDETGTQGPRNEVRAQTLINEEGLIPTGPGAGGGGTSGLVPMKANAFVTGGSLELEASVPILGLSTPVSVALPTSTGTSTFRAVSTTSCTTKSLAVNVLDVLDLSGGAAAVTADDDGRSVTSATPAASNVNGLVSVAPVAGALLGNTLSSPVSCSAAATPLPTETGTGSGLTVSAGKNIGLLGLLNLATIQAAPSTQSVSHQTVAGKREILASGSGSVTSARVLSLPLISSGLVSVDALSYGASVRASEGTPSAAPEITNTAALTVRVYDPVPILGSGQLGAGCTTGLNLGPGITATRQGLLTASYCRYVVNPNAAGFTGVSIPVSSGLPGVLTFTTTVDILAPSKSGAAGTTGAGGEKRWSAAYTPIKVDAAMNLLGLGSASVGLNLGGVQTEACAGATCL